MGRRTNCEGISVWGFIDPWHLLQGWNPHILGPWGSRGELSDHMGGIYSAGDAHRVPDFGASVLLLLLAQPGHLREVAAQEQSAVPRPREGQGRDCPDVQGCLHD